MWANHIISVTGSLMHPVRVNDLSLSFQRFWLQIWFWISFSLFESRNSNNNKTTRRPDKTYPLKDEHKTKPIAWHLFFHHVFGIEVKNYYVTLIRCVRLVTSGLHSTPVFLRLPHWLPACIASLYVRSTRIHPLCLRDPSSGHWIHFLSSFACFCLF